MCSHDKDDVPADEESGSWCIHRAMRPDGQERRCSSLSFPISSVSACLLARSASLLVLCGCGVRDVFSGCDGGLGSLLLMVIPSLEILLGKPDSVREPEAERGVSRCALDRLQGSPCVASAVE